MADQIQHVVVLMFENNSFDRMLGCMQEVYPQLDGVDPAQPPRTNPAYRDATQLYAQLPVALNAPRKDPAHESSNVLRQLENHNQGFVSDFMQSHQGAPAEDRYQVMAYFKRGQLPVLHSLAEHFAVCDRWFSSVPGPTWTNRFFVHSGTSLGQADMPISFFQPNLFIYDQDTIYDRFHNKVTWNIYYGDVPQSLLLVHQLAHPRHYKRHDDFFAACAGPVRDFPQYSFIEPYYFGAKQNDQHPPSDVLHGDALLGRVYNALRANEELWKSALLVVLYDEHGGFYDHVEPPAAVPPDEQSQKPEFNRLGVRVPALLISPWVDPGVISTVFDHTSLLKYAIDKWGLGPLGARTAQANTFAADLQKRQSPRTDCPPAVAVPAAVPNPEDAPVNHNQAALWGFTHHVEANLTKPDDATLADHSRKMASGDNLDQSKTAAARIRNFLAKPV